MLLWLALKEMESNEEPSTGDEPIYIHCLLPDSFSPTRSTEYEAL